MSQDSIIEKVRKLHRKATDHAATPAEAAAFAAKVAELMEKHALDEAVLIDHGAPPTEANSEEVRATLDVDFSSCLGFHLAQLTFCRFIHLVGERKRGAFMLVGTDHGRAIFLYLFETIRRDARIGAEIIGMMREGKARQFQRRSYLFGFARTIGERVEEILRSRQAQSGNAVVIYQGAQAKTDAKVEEIIAGSGRTLTTSKTTQVQTNPEAYQMGRDAGHHANLSGTALDSGVGPTQGRIGA